ncbi:MAG: methylenetetrahydrofolate reductase [NAD(P)H] [Elusimicrobiota bacterium]|jgi:methylenetetrahydrofolate reductase (NADPH)
MRIPELLGRGKPVFSFEFFQPKTTEDVAAFEAVVRDLRRLEPAFLTITYGAAGSAREKTFDTAAWIQRETGIAVAAHLTCIGHTRAEIDALLDRISALGIENIVALRGDLPQDGSAPPPELRELPYAADLVRRVRARGRFAVAVAGYPEKHPEAPSMEEDLRRLKEKVAEGADWIITQLFFDNADYFAFVERARRAGLRCPIVPGIMPVTSFAQTRKFTALCGARLPARMIADLEPLAEDRAAVARYGVEWALRQCRGLLEGGAPGIHFYTLNKSHATSTILSRLKER